MKRCIYSVKLDFMQKTIAFRLNHWLLKNAAVLWINLICTVVFAQSPAEPSAAQLLEKHAELVGQLERNAYKRPIYLASSEGANLVNGEVYAVLQAPFDRVSSEFKSPNHWCEVMILPINTKYCRSVSDSSPSTLKINIGKKTMQELADTYQFDFGFNVASNTPDYLAVLLKASKGPYGTYNYKIELYAVPLPSGKTFLHLRYAYGYGFASRIALQGYLAAVGGRKVGFTQIVQNQKHIPVSGMRGAVERNTMRYYLAIEAYLATLGQPAGQQFNLRLDHWFEATEEYPDQFNDIDKNSYLAIKKSEYQRQKTRLPG